jgi:hypothetical protein
MLEVTREVVPISIITFDFETHAFIISLYVDLPVSRGFNLSYRVNPVSFKLHSPQLHVMYRKWANL